MDVLTRYKKGLFKKASKKICLLKKIKNNYPKFLIKNRKISDSEQLIFLLKNRNKKKYSNIMSDMIKKKNIPLITEAYLHSYGFQILKTSKNLGYSNTIDSFFGRNILFEKEYLRIKIFVFKNLKNSKWKIKINEMRKKSWQILYIMNLISRILASCKKCIFHDRIGTIKGIILKEIYSNSNIDIIAEKLMTIVKIKKRKKCDLIEKIIQITRPVLNTQKIKEVILFWKLQLLHRLLAPELNFDKNKNTFTHFFLKKTISKHATQTSLLSFINF
jgi:hypothetical protein